MTASPVLRLVAVMAVALGALALAPGALPASAQEASTETGAPPSGADPVLEALQSGTLTTAGGSVRPPADAVVPVPTEPGQSRERDYSAEAAAVAEALAAQGGNSQSTLWAEVRAGETFTTQAPGPNTAFLVQDSGMPWQAARSAEGYLQVWGAWIMLGMVGLLALFYLLRGRIRIEHGFSGELIERFKPIERFGHWLLAGSFVLLALTGLNLLFGKDYLMPLIGKDAFAEVAAAGKWVHNNVAWAFMAGLVLVFFMWVLHNIPSRLDLQWLAKGGGLFSKNVHPDSRKFNAGQKLIFWSTIILGGSISASGLSLLFPYELPMFAKTFAVLNDLGAEAVLGSALPETLSPIEEMQYAQLWHTIVSIVMIAIIVAHIYIGSVGMQGAFAAMGSGLVDRNWAKEHHNLWVDEHDAEEAQKGRKSPPMATPAE